MLQSLHITNFAILSAVTVELEPGLTAFTGETGAGKSILVDAINLLLGGRASSELIRTGEDAATVEALFTLGTEARRAVDEAGVTLEGDELLVKRVVSRSGKNRVFLNGGPATLAMLESLAPKLIDIAGQHEHQTLLLPESHREVVDSAGGHAPLVEAVREAYAALSRARREAEALAAKDADRGKREDYLRFQVDELAKLAPKEGEEDALALERGRLVHAESLGEAVTASEEALYSADGAILARLKTVQSRIAAAARLDPGLEPIAATLESARIELEEAAHTLRDYRSGTETDPERLSWVDDRLVALDRCRKKHGAGSGPEGTRTLIALQAALEAELKELSSFEEALAAKRSAEGAARTAAELVAAKLTEARKKTAKKLATEIQTEVRGLGMPHTRFEIDVREAVLSSTGGDDIEFLISPNPGEGVKPLAKTASGGELSRVMLALKCVIAEHHPVATYIFDEVDAGVGGAIAEHIGQKLRSVARGSHQVFCITHLPQVAALADQHIQVKKHVAAGRTGTLVEKLSETAREDELARMMGGVEITAATRAHAREMLQQGKRPATQGRKTSARSVAARTARKSPS